MDILHRFIGCPIALEFSCVDEASKDGAGTIVGAPPVFNKKQSLIDAIEIDQDWLARMFDVRREASPAGGGTPKRSLALGRKLKLIDKRLSALSKLDCSKSEIQGSPSYSDVQRLASSECKQSASKQGAASEVGVGAVNAFEAALDVEMADEAEPCRASDSCYPALTKLLPPPSTDADGIPTERLIDPRKESPGTTKLGGYPCTLSPG